MKRFIFGFTILCSLIFIPFAKANADSIIPNPIVPKCNVGPLVQVKGPDGEPARYQDIDPVTGKETFLFSFFNQDQLLDNVDFKNLNQRLKTNSVLEKLSNLYLTYLFSKSDSSSRMCCRY